MYIKNLKLTNFGKFHDRSLKLTEGINIIFGENEAGKSTVHTFIKSMFFGISRLRGRAAASDSYTIYEPWENPGYYEGVMEFCEQKKQYRIERVFQKSIKKIRITDLGMGKVIGDEEGCIGRIIEGLEESTFSNTISTSQSDIGIDGIILNLNHSKSSEINISEAVNGLYEKRKNMDNKIHALGIDELESRLKEYVDIDHKIASLAASLEIEKQNLIEAEKEITISKTPDRKQYIENHRLPHTTERRNVVFQKMGVLLPIVALVFAYGFIKLHKYTMLVFAIMAAIVDILIIYYSVKKSVPFRSNKEMNGNNKESMTDTSRREQIYRRIEKITWEMDSAIQLANRRDELTEELNSARKKQEELEKEKSSLSLAISSIQNHSKTIEEDFGEELNRIASEYISRFTRGKYDNLRISDSKKVTICEEGRVIGVSSVSYATREQIYLSIRLAASKLLFQRPMPLVLDEVFAHYDDDRMEDTLLSLVSMGVQVILFTCTHREEKILSDNKIQFQLLNLS